MSRNLKILIVIAILAIMVVVVGMFASYAATAQQRTWQPGQRLITVDPSDLENYLMARTIVSTINISLLLVLVITYASIFLKTRSEFSIGLLIFALVFLLKDVSSSPLLIGMFGYGLFGYGMLVPWFNILPDLFELVALSILLYLSVKY